MPWSLADKIEVLNAANSIEAKPHCTRQKHSIADEPITARIGRRAESIPASDPAIELDASALPTGTFLPPESTAQAIPEDLTPSETPPGHSSTTRDLSIKPEMTFQERIAIEWRRNESPERKL